METINANELIEAIKSSLPSFRIDGLLSQKTGMGFILDYLCKRQGETVIAKDIAMGLGCSLPRVTALLESCEEKGFVSIERDEGDKRKKIVSITEKGRRRWQSAEAEIDSLLGKIVEEVGEDEVKEFLGIGKRISAIVERERKEEARQINGGSEDE